MHAAQQLTQVEPALSEFQESDFTHGCTVHRTVRVFAAPALLSQHWCGLEAIVAVQRQGVRKGHDFHRHSWLILSQVIPAEQAAALIRNHRGSIENKLHGVKDAVQGEDNAEIRAANPAKLVALLRSWTISVFCNQRYDSITKAMRLFKHDLPKLLSFL